jgi:hypothetical protein
MAQLGYLLHVLYMIVKEHKRIHEIYSVFELGVSPSNYTWKASWRRGHAYPKLGRAGGPSIRPSLSVQVIIAMIHVGPPLPPQSTSISAPAILIPYGETLPSEVNRLVIDVLSSQNTMMSHSHLHVGLGILTNITDSRLRSWIIGFS